MARSEDEKRGLSRREFMQDTGLTTLALGAGAVGVLPATTTLAQNAEGSAASAEQGPYNILFILTDQERFFDPSEYPSGYRLPGHERLQKRGVTFTNHQVNSMVCTSSRSVIYTGRHIQHTKLFDNMDFPWMEDLSHDIPTLGNMLAEAGYYAAYKGKWHMSKALGTHDELALPQERLTKVIESYGFNDYVGIGDVIGLVQGGYLNDDMILAQARRWLRLHGRRLRGENKPWLLAVNIVNPHDVMFYNTDSPGQHVQDTPKPLLGVAREPNTPLYRQQWDIRLPDSRKEPFDKEGRPAAHREYQQSRAALVGAFPNEDGRWRRLLNYYFNCIQEADRAVDGILDELDALGFADNTIVVMTSDHGELGGAHGTHGKGATTYREQNHVPLIVSHPDYPETYGQRCSAVTSHLDLAPSFVAWTGVDADQRARIGRDLRGKDLTPLLSKGESAGLDDLRSGALYCYNMLAYLDSDLMTQVQAFLNAGGERERVRDLNIAPDFTKRGAIRSVFDGRYKYSRYFSPKQFNQPRTLEDIFAVNDVELFDLKADPDETQNLSLEPKKHGELLLAMNEKMNALIEAEVGIADDGSFLPAGDSQWAAAEYDP